MRARWNFRRRGDLKWKPNPAKLHVLLAIARSYPIAWSAYTAIFSIVSAAPTSFSTRKIATLCLIYTSRVRVLSIVHVHRLDLIRVHVRTSTQDDNPSKAPQLLLVCNGCSPRSFRIFSDPRVAPPTCCKLVKLYYSYVLPCRFAQTGQMRG
jgi:hypothetical protein